MTSSTEANSSALRRLVQPSVHRESVEFLMILGLSVLIFRTFVAEAYVVPTGSMAPTLLGYHRELTCTFCSFVFPLGMDEQGRSSAPICPNCGETNLREAPAVSRDGDRLLVQKYLFELRSPRRWEVIVFQTPVESDQPFVKRVVGLPGESILLFGGDVYVNGTIARKSLEEIRAMRLIVYDNNHVPSDVDRFPRWMPRRGGFGDFLASGWTKVDKEFHREAPLDGKSATDWLLYRHWDPSRPGYGPVRDGYAYNGTEVRVENRVPDLMLEAEVAIDPVVRSVKIQISRGMDRFIVTIPTNHDLPEVPVTVERNGRGLSLEERARTAPLVGSSLENPRYHRLEAALADRRLMVAIDGRLLFTPIDFDDPIGSGPRSPSPIGVGVDEGAARLRNIKIFRDVYYTNSIATGPTRPHAVDRPFELSEGEYFVLGDNSPVSNDSRFWPESPVVRREWLVGKPFLVHIPSQAIPLRVFGHTTCWIPDPREIRYIR